MLLLHLGGPSDDYELHAVRGLVPGKRDRTNLGTLSEAMAFCLDQRAFGPRRLVVAFANRNGRFRGLAFTPVAPSRPKPRSLGALITWGAGPRSRSRSVMNR